MNVSRNSLNSLRHASFLLAAMGLLAHACAVVSDQSDPQAAVEPPEACEGAQALFRAAPLMRQEDVERVVESAASTWIDDTHQALSNAYRGATVQSGWQDGGQRPVRDCPWTLEPGDPITEKLNVRVDPIVRKRSRDSGGISLSWSGQIEAAVRLPYSMWSEYSSGRFAKPRQTRHGTHVMSFYVSLHCEVNSAGESTCKHEAIHHSHEGSSVDGVSPPPFDVTGMADNLIKVALERLTNSTDLPEGFESWLDCECRDEAMALNCRVSSCGRQLSKELSRNHTAQGVTANVAERLAIARTDRRREGMVPSLRVNTFWQTADYCWAGGPPNDIEIRVGEQTIGRFGPGQHEVIVSLKTDDGTTLWTIDDHQDTTTIGLVAPLKLHDATETDEQFPEGDEHLPLGCELGIVSAAIEFSQDRISSQLATLESSIREKINLTQTLKMVYNGIRHGDTAVRCMLLQTLDRLKESEAERFNRPVDNQDLTESSRELLSQLALEAFQRGLVYSPAWLPRHLNPPFGGWLWLLENENQMRNEVEEEMEICEPQEDVFLGPDGEVNNHAGLNNARSYASVHETLSHYAQDLVVLRLLTGQPPPPEDVLREFSAFGFSVGQ